MTTPVWISLGSNLGDRRAILDAAVVALNQSPGVFVSRVSSYRETVPVGGPPGQGSFLNAAARLETDLTPRELLAATQAIERDLGRVRLVRWGERTLDIDLLIFATKFLDEPDLKLPHPRLAVRRFVLEPLAEIAPDVVDTITFQTIANLLTNLDRRPRIVMIDESIVAVAPGLCDLLAMFLDDEVVDLAATHFDLPFGMTREWMKRQGREIHGLMSLATIPVRGPESEPSWFVTNFAVDVPRIRKFQTRAFDEYLQDEDFMVRAIEYPKIWFSIHRSRIIDSIPDPTLIVASPNSRFARKAGVNQTPIYYPDAIEPDAIVAEVVAVCRGIAGECRVGEGVHGSSQLDPL